MRVVLLMVGLQLLLMAAAVAGPESVEEGMLVRTYVEAVTRMDKANWAGARAATLKLIASPKFKKGDLEYVGAVRALIDELRSRKQEKLANEVLAAANKAVLGRGDAAKALAGRRVSQATAQKKLAPFTRKRRSGGIFNPTADLKRVRVGNQASVLKILDTNGKNLYFKGIDGVMWAPVYDKDRDAQFAALGIQAQALDVVAAQLMQLFPTLEDKKETIAVLGVIGSSPSGLSDASRAQLEAFFINTMRGDSDVVVRRQTLLALALQSKVSPAAVDAVVDFYGKSENVWETFPVQQFFEYHQAEIKAQPNHADIKTKVTAIDGLYTESILKFL